MVANQFVRDRKAVSSTVRAPDVLISPVPVRSVKTSELNSRLLLISKLVRVDVAVDDVAVKNSDTVSPTTESLAYGEVVPIPRLPEESSLMNSVREPLVFLFENVRADSGVASETSVNTEAIREVEVAVDDAVTVPRYSLENRSPAPIPAPGVEEAE